MFRREGDVHVAEIFAEPERSVELFASLIDELPQQIDLTIWCARSGERFAGEGRFRSEVDEGLRALLPAVAAVGGVEIALYSAEDQLTLSLSAELWVYTRSPRWPLVLASRGLVERTTADRRSWTVNAGDFCGAPHVIQAVCEVAERLTLSTSGRG